MDPGHSRDTRAFASEVKFLVTRPVGAAIRDWARERMPADPHGSGPFGDEYATATIYFDSPDYDVFHRRGSYGTSKYRVRRYGDGPGVFLERKLRRPGMLTKRRTLVDLPALTHLERYELQEWPGDWFHRRLLLRSLRPVCEVSYHRMARVGTSPTGPIRLTLDDQLRAFPVHGAAFGNGIGAAPLIEQQMVLELKYRSDVPALFKQLVERFGLHPQSASKYRMGIAAVDADALCPVPVHAVVGHRA